MQKSHPALASVSPNECALAVTIPLTREQFLDDLARPEEKDLVHHFRAQRGLQKAAPEFCWEAYLEDEGTFAEAVCSEVERLGVTVRYGARPADLTELLRKFSVVTLLAHWRFVPVEQDDILDAPGLLQLLWSPGNRVQQTAKQAFELLDPQLLHSETCAQLSDSDLCKRIARVIRMIAEEAERLYWDTATDQDFELEMMPDGLSGRLTRVEFEQAFTGCITPARAVEFEDCLHTMPELIDAVPEEFSGLLDLTLCNSVIPAGHVRRKRQNCLIAANRRPAELKGRLYLYGLQISLLAKQPMPFAEVIKQVHTGAHAHKKEGGKRWNLFVRYFNSIRKRH